MFSYNIPVRVVLLDEAQILYCHALVTGKQPKRPSSRPVFVLEAHDLPFWAHRALKNSQRTHRGEQQHSAHPLEAELVRVRSQGDDAPTANVKV